jgi:ribonucleoside-triphosphate reductase
VAGAVAVANFDTYLAPFIREDRLSYKEVKQAMQEFVYNMNVPTRVGFQTPFSNVTLDLSPEGAVAEEAVIIGGKPIKAQYKDYQKEMDMFNRAFAEVMMEGDAQGRVFTFPIPTYSVTKDFDWDNSVLEPVFEMTRKYGIPYWANYINSDMKPEDSRSMCCRLKLDNRVLRKRGGLFAANPLTGSVGVVTINLPRIGHTVKTAKEFYQKLNKLLRLAKDSLLIKREAVEKFTAQGLYPYCRFYLGDVKKRTGKYWANHFNTIGIVGMNEAIANLLGKSIVDREGREFALEVMSFIRKRILQYQRSTGELFNLEATPAEGTSYRFARIDKQQHKDIMVANQGDRKNGEAEPFYTNSTYLPVDWTDDIFDALDHQDELQCKYNGGTVFHGFLGESPGDNKAVKGLIKKIASGYNLPYFTLTPTFSICRVHGYIKGEHKFCPKCKGKKERCEIYSRVVGYLRPVSQWNPGKEAEFDKRKTYRLS